MATYRVTIPIIFTVEINGANENTPENKILRGDTSDAAARRALKCLLAKEENRLAERKALGIKRIMTKRPSVERVNVPSGAIPIAQEM